MQLRIGSGVSDWNVPQNEQQSKVQHEYTCSAVAKASRISDKHIARLEEIGFEWNVRGVPIPKVDPSEFEGMIIWGFVAKSSDW